MTDQQRRFAEEYVKDHNPQRAYKAAYPHIKTDAAALCVSGTGGLTTRFVMTATGKRFISLKKRFSPWMRLVATTWFPPWIPMVSSVDTNGLPSDNQVTAQQTNERSERKQTNEREGPAHFFPPTLEQVQEYVQEEGLNLEPERFFNYYSARSWMMGACQMSDWRAAARSWATREKEVQQHGIYGGGHATDIPGQLPATVRA